MSDNAPRQEIIALKSGRSVSLWRWPGRGRPLVALHGLFDSARGWQSVAERSSRPVIAFDLPGFGDSDLPDRALFSSYARAIGEGLRLIDVTRYDLVGHSLGGAVASYLTIPALSGLPRPPRSLTLLAPAGYGKLPLAQFAALPLIAPASGLSTQLIMSSNKAINLIYRNFVSNGRSAQPELLERLTDSAGRATPAARAAVRALAHSGMGERALPRQRGFYKGPVAALWGDHDRLVPVSHARGVLRGLPQTELRVWRGMGHHPQAERPAELSRMLKAIQDGERVPGRPPSSFRDEEANVFEQVQAVLAPETP